MHHDGKQTKIMLWGATWRVNCVVVRCMLWYWCHLLQFDRMYIAFINVTMTVHAMAMAMAMTMAMTMMFCGQGWSGESKIYCRIAALTMGEERA